MHTPTLIKQTLLFSIYNTFLFLLQGQGFDPETVLAGHRIVKALDPYHPSLLVTNCMLTAPVWAPIADIIMTDVYPIG